MLLTILTPTYNRAYCLNNLYESLCRQSNCDFEWIIVDDGSTDNTHQVVGKWMVEQRINIRYIQQSNGGKHRAINRGIKIANGDFIFIVDSDDYLSDDAVEWINKEAYGIKNDSTFAGISGIRIRPDGTKIGEGENFGVIDSNAIEIRLKHNIKGDLAEIYKTDILKKFPFPEYDGEKFCPEALIWFRIGRLFKMRYIYKGIYVCEYLDDGLTAKITRIRHQSPKASMLYYSEHFHDLIPLKWKLKAAINFWRFQDSSYGFKYKMLSPLSLIGYLPGKIMAILDIYK